LKTNICILYFIFEIHFENVICICIWNTCWYICILFSSKKYKIHFDVGYHSRPLIDSLWIMSYSQWSRCQP